MTEDEPWSGLKRWTTARIALGRTGDALPTRRVLSSNLPTRKPATPFTFPSMSSNWPAASPR